MAERVTQGTLFDGLQGSSEAGPWTPGRWAGASQAMAPPAPEAVELHSDVTTLEDLREAVLECRRCDLRSGCRGVVFGEGDPRANLMLVGEGPGAVEDELGRPFVGPAGKLLDKILEAAGFARREVYIANIVKCRPPGNRLPTPEEAARCLPNLKAQIRVIAPRLIVCLGALSTQIMVDAKARITSARGTWYERKGLRIMPTFHPAALLRDPSKKRAVWEDFKKVRAAYEDLRSSEGAGSQNPGPQNAGLRSEG